MAIIETEVWIKNPDKPGTLIFDHSRVAEDIFNELEAHLKADGRMPDEYFLLKSDWKDGKLFPKDGEILCNANYGGSEGVYLDIYISYQKEVYEHSRETGVLGWHKRTAVESFATGKTLGRTIDDLDKMNLVASSVFAAFYGMEAEVKERYTGIESGKVQPVYPLPPGEAKVTAKTLFREVEAGDWVIAAANSDYGYLLGTVTAIDKLGTPERTTENETDDIHVDFTAFDYPPERIAEIEEVFSDLYGEPKTFDDLPLDDVIMAPNEIISISNLSHDEITRMGNLLANCEAFCKCFPSGIRPEGKLGDLMDRLDTNLEAYHDNILGFEKREIFEMAEKITAMSDAHLYMTSHHEFESAEIEFLLQFQNPLEVVADVWIERHGDISDMSYTMGDVLRDKELLQAYPLTSEAAASINDPIIMPPTGPVSREAIQAYNMEAPEFEKLMYKLLPDASITAMMNWKGYASSLEKDETITKAEFFLQMYIEFDLVKQHHGEPVALLLFNHGEHFTLNPFEIRGAANHILDGRHITEIDTLAVDGKCDMSGQEMDESNEAVRAFISNSEKTEHEQVVNAVRSMDYGMDASEFEQRMAVIFPGGTPEAIAGWIEYSNDMEADTEYPKAKSLVEYCVEFSLIKQHYGEELATRLFNIAEISCSAPFELRAAARLLQDGAEISKIPQMVVDNDFMTDKAEDIEFGKALIAFAENRIDISSIVVPMTDDQKAAIQRLEERAERITGTTTPTLSAEQPPAAKKSIGDRIKAGNEKVQAYKDQQAQNPQTSTRKKEENLE